MLAVGLTTKSCNCSSTALKAGCLLLDSHALQSGAVQPQLYQGMQCCSDTNTDNQPAVATHSAVNESDAVQSARTVLLLRTLKAESC